MVIWLFAGGGYSEIYGLIPFLEKNYPQHQFQRKTPARPKLKKKDLQKNRFRASQIALGQTGKQFSVLLKNQLSQALLDHEHCDLIFVLDDLDCKDPQMMTAFFLRRMDEVSNTDSIEKHVGFASPEMEAWLIADWSNSFASHTAFKPHESALKHDLSIKQQVSFESPESFSEYNKETDSCKEKLSSSIVKSCKDIGAPNFSKKDHTPEMLKKLDAEIIQSKCPLFREIHKRLVQQ